MKVFEKINIAVIVRNHLSTLVNDNSKKADFSDWFSFLIIPVVGAIALVCLGVRPTERVNTIIISTLSILIGLFFNVVVILFDIIKRDNNQEIKNELLKQLLTNILYSILLSLIIIGITILSFFENKYWKLICYFLTFFLLIHFALTVLMILKRIYVLFTNEMKKLEN